MAHPQPYLDNTSQPWAKWITTEVENGNARDDRLENDIQNQLKQLNSSITNLNAQVKALPINQVFVNRNIGIGVNGTYTPYASFGFYVPEGKRGAKVIINANAALLDTTTAGVTTAYGRINFGGLTSVEFPASKDAGASQVNNIIVANYGYNVNLNPGGYYNISFELKGLNPTAYPVNAQNFALITALVSFGG